MGLTLYQMPLSPTCRAISLLLEINNVTYETVNVNILKGEQKTGSFAKINPAEKVPAIDHDGFKLSQSVAILQYLTSALPDIADHWYPADIKTRAKVNEYMIWHMSDGVRLAAMFRGVIWPKLQNRPVDVASVKKLGDGLNNALNLIEHTYLKDTDFVAGDNISIADLLAIADVMHNVAVGYPVTRGRPRFEKWMERCKEKLHPVFDPIHEPIITLCQPHKWSFE